MSEAVEPEQVKAWSQVVTATMEALAKVTAESTRAFAAITGKGSAVAEPEDSRTTKRTKEDIIAELQDKRAKKGSYNRRQAG